MGMAFRRAARAGRGDAAVIFILTFENNANRDKFEYLYERYKNLLLRKAYEILGDAMLAEDAASEAYLRIYKNLHKIEDVSSPRSIAFMVTIVRNVALTMLKKRGNEIAEPFGEEEADPLDLEETVVASMSSEQVYTMLGRLDEELRQLFLLKYAYDMSHRQIAEVLCTSENNVTVKLHRAKKKLAGILREEGVVHG